MIDYEKTSGIEYAMSCWFPKKKYVIVPNVSWGMFPYEMDLCALNHRSRYATEIEIKISRADLKRDSLKRHQHDSVAIRWLWFAMPEKLRGYEEFVMERAGIFYVSKDGKVSIFRHPKQNKESGKWDDDMAYTLAGLGTMRYWQYWQNTMNYSSTVTQATL